MFKKLIVFSIIVVAGVVSAQEGPPTVDGVIKDPTLVQNQDIAKAQAVGAITTFMSKGAQECDAEGKNCRSLFGSDDSMDYSSMQMSTKALTGVDSFSFAGDDDSSNSVSSQMGTAALACGDKEVKMVAGVAIKMLECSVAANGNAQAKVQVCTATARGNPVVNPDNAVPCSSDPSAPNFKAPFGQVCMKPACDSEPVNSLNGWSSPATINWQASLPSNTTDAEKSNNGLVLVFYPALTGGTAPSFSADSDNMTALKIVQSFKDNETGASAIGLRVAYRYKVQITKDMLAGGSAAVPNPKDHSSSWETIEKLQGNALIPQYQAQYAANGSECLQQIQNGIASDGVVSVCDPGYTNESGIRPIALTAQVGTEDQDCSSVPQCLKEVVNTNTWKESCSADVPLAMRSCSTKQDYTMETVSYTRTRTEEICHEERVTAEYGCTTSVVDIKGSPVAVPLTNFSQYGSTAAQTVLKRENVFQLPEGVIKVGLRITYLNFDNWGELRLNGTRIWAALSGNLHNVKDEDTYNSCYNDSWQEEYCGSRPSGEFCQWRTVKGVSCLLDTGKTARANYSDAYYGEYTGNVEVDLSLLKSGTNSIQMSCFNNLGPSACNYQLELIVLPMDSLVIENQCSSYEAAN